jgi:hypothetical protein
MLGSPNEYKVFAATGERRSMPHRYKKPLNLDHIPGNELN